MESLDDPFRLAECNRSIPDHICNLTAICPLKNAIAEVHQRLRDVLRNVTLADLFRQVHPGSEQTTLGMLIPSLPAEKQFAVN
jgi:DNA-binding IscR family transcriptional regulator